MIFVPRFVKEVPKQQSPDGRSNSEVIALDSLRSVPAWVLLGEPGAGKSSAFAEEANASNGLCLTIAEFISSDIETEWSHRCLFLDGLDEVRASNTDQTILHQVRARLKKLGMPHFRIACRAADWYGQSDQEDIIGASPNGKLPIYALEPLKLEEIKEILTKNSNITDTDAFIAQAETHGIRALLSNPQTLQLIVESTVGSTIDSMGEAIWPISRDEIYRLACKTLVQEANKRHRDRTRDQPVSKEDLLDTAGRLFATLLLSDKSGIALDLSAQNERFPNRDDLQMSASNLVSSVLSTKLFVPSSSSEERLEPTHRSVAEYLAAQWLGQQIDQHGLSQQRVLKLMVGFDGKAVAGLRGLYGWLALKSLKARQSLIKNDPLTVALYSDLHPMSRGDKAQLLREIFLQIQDNPATLWDFNGTENLATLFHAELRDAYLTALQDAKRDEATQTYVVFILKVLKQSSSQANLRDALKNVAADGSRWGRIRRHALEAWLDSGIASSEAITFLDQLNQGDISDPDEELAGILLAELFPKELAAADVLHYFHIPINKLSGMYEYFWTYDFPKKVHDDDLPFALNQLAKRRDLQSLNLDEFDISCMLATLVARGVQAHGDNIADAELFTWLRIGTDEYGERRHQPEFHNAITEWLTQRPERYKGLLGICFDRNENHPSPLEGLFNDSQVLRGIPAPSDIGLWHFQQIDQTKNEVLINKHLTEAAHSIWSGQQGLTIEMLLEWAGNDSVKFRWLEPHLAWPTSNGLKEWKHYTQDKEREQAEHKKKLSEELAKTIPEIRDGSALPALMYALANVWLNRDTNTRGETPLDRFKNYCDNYAEVWSAVKAGMPACIRRKDLPPVKDIIGFNLQQRYHLIRSACLLGMELLWAETPSDIDSLDNSILEKMVCFHLTDILQSTTPDWFMHLVKTNPELVVKILVAYASASFKAQKDYVNGIHALEREAAYTPIARLSVPVLLKNFPTRNKASQLNQLGSLLRSALKYAMPELAVIIANKIKLKSLDPSQRVYFLLAGTLINPAQYEQALWDFVGPSWQRVQHISNFLSNRFNDLPMDLNLSAQTFGKLIEIQTPFAEFDWLSGGGFVSPAMQLGDHVRGLLGKLTALGTKESLEEINRLLTLPSLEKIKQHLLSSKREAIQKLRENSFSHPTLSDVANILSNHAPTGPADLQIIVLDCLDQIAQDIRTSNADLFRQFWTEGKGKNNQHKSEPSCRDALLEMLRNHLAPRGIDCHVEFDHAKDKRVDISVSYQSKYVLPIEIKGEWHRELWTAIQTQLIPRYTKPKETDGYGVYLVFWVGGSKQPTVEDGGKKPSTPDELELRLHNNLPEEFQKRIAVKVIDVTPPNS